MVHGLKFSVSSIGHCINDAHHAALLPALLAAMPSTLSSGHVLPPGSSSSTPSKTAHMKMYGVRTSKASVGLKVSAGAGRRAARGSVVVQVRSVMSLTH